MDNFPQNVTVAAGFDLNLVVFGEKYVTTYVAGHRTSEETALRLILRGLSLPNVFSNDHTWMAAVKGALGFVPDNGVYGVNRHREPDAYDAFTARVPPLDLRHLSTNGTLLDDHAFSLVDEAWIHPNGMIAGRVQSGRYPSPSEIVTELSTIASAFPEVHFVAWNFADDGDIPMMCVVRDGHVHVGPTDEPLIDTYLDLSGYAEAEEALKGLAEQLKFLKPEEWHAVIDQFHANLGTLKSSPGGHHLLMDAASLSRALTLFP